MEFSKAYEALKQGKKIKRSHWAGCWERSGSNIAMHCKNGEDILLTDTKDVFFTVNNMIADDWEIVDGYLPEEIIPTFTFGEAIRRLKQGQKVARNGWNGRGIFIGLQKPECDLEVVAESVHDAWWDEKKKQGVTDHPDMIPYSDLSEATKEYDRATARATIEAMSYMTHPYIFIDTTGLQTDNPHAPKNRVPWLASQTDMLAEDWIIV